MSEVSFFLTCGDVELVSSIGSFLVKSCSLLTVFIQFVNCHLAMWFGIEDQFH